MTSFDLPAVILAAKLGAARRDAQVDCCGPFAAALYDALKARGLSCSLHVASPAGSGRLSTHWYHAVVRFQGRYYDSLGEFSAEIYRTRMKMRAGTPFSLVYRRDRREGAVEAELTGMHDFYLKALSKALNATSISAATADLSAAAAPVRPLLPLPPDGGDDAESPAP